MIDGVESSVGAGQTFIRKSGSAGYAQAGVISGTGIIDIASSGTSLTIRFYRTDASTDGTVDRLILNVLPGE